LSAGGSPSASARPMHGSRKADRSIKNPPVEAWNGEAIRARGPTDTKFLRGPGPAGGRFLTGCGSVSDAVRGCRGSGLLRRLPPSLYARER